MGGHLLFGLLTESKPVRAVLRPGTNPEKVLQVWKHLHPDPHQFLQKIEWVEADLCDRMALEEIIPPGCLVYHCAAEVSFSPSDMRKVYRTNVEATRTLVDVCLEQKISRFLHVSSIAAVGRNEDGGVSREDEPWSGRKSKGYGDSKLQAELEVWRGMAEGLHAVIVNPSVILGAGHWKRSSARIFDTIYRGLKYFTRGVTGYVDARDVARAMVLLMNSDKEGVRYILSAENLSFEEIFSLVAKHLGVPPPRVYVGKKMGSLTWRVERILSLLTGHAPRVTQQSIQAAHEKSFYSSDKFSADFNFEFRPVEETVKYVAEAYLRDCRTT